MVTLGRGEDSEQGFQTINGSGVGAPLQVVKLARGKFYCEREKID